MEIPFDNSSRHSTIIPPFIPNTPIETQIPLEFSAPKVMRVMPNDIINGFSIPRTIINHAQSHHSTCPFDSRPHMEYFDTLKDVENRLRGYTKEAGFGLILVQASGTDKNIYRLAKCTKGVQFKKKTGQGQEPEIAID